jgi:hypothetical protein
MNHNIAVLVFHVINGPKNERYKIGTNISARFMYCFSDDD